MENQILNSRCYNDHVLIRRIICYISTQLRCLYSRDKETSFVYPTSSSLIDKFFATCTIFIFLERFQCCSIVRPFEEKNN